METTQDVPKQPGAGPARRMVDPNAMPKARLTARMSRHHVPRKVLSRKVLAMDLTSSASFPLPERTSYLGALLTMVAVGLWLTYIVTLTLVWAKNPPRSTSDIRWSSGHDPFGGSGPPSFPIELVCSAAEGCGIALHYSGQTPVSAKCAASVANKGCVTAAQGERLSTALCYSDQPEDGLYAFHAAIANASLGLLSVSEAPLMECAACPNLRTLPCTLDRGSTIPKPPHSCVRQKGFPPPPWPHPAPLCRHHERHLRRGVAGAQPHRMVPHAAECAAAYVDNRGCPKRTRPPHAIGRAATSCCRAYRPPTACLHAAMPLPASACQSMPHACMPGGKRLAWGGVEACLWNRRQLRLSTPNRVACRAGGARRCRSGGDACVRRHCRQVVTCCLVY